MVTIAEAIRVLRPLAEFGVNGVNIGETNGIITITGWKSAWGTQPTIAELSAVKDAQLAIANDTIEQATNPERRELRQAIAADIQTCDDIIALTSVNLAQALARLKDLARINKRILRYLRRNI